MKAELASKSDRVKQCKDEVSEVRDNIVLKYVLTAQNPCQEVQNCHPWSTLLSRMGQFLYGNL